jgi:hypothetical protein
MYRTVVLTAAFAALALPAAAATSVTVNIAGLDSKAAHAKIVRGAEVACIVELRDESTLMAYYERPDCINDAVARAEASLPIADASLTTNQGRFARR